VTERVVPPTMDLIEQHTRWLQLRGLSANTIDQRRGRLRRMLAALDLADAADVTGDQLADWQQGWRLSPQSHCT
jgi:hypothetical protein